MLQSLPEGKCPQCGETHPVTLVISDHFVMDPSGMKMIFCRGSAEIPEELELPKELVELAGQLEGTEEPTGPEPHESGTDGEPPPDELRKTEGSS